MTDYFHLNIKNDKLISLSTHFYWCPAKLSFPADAGRVVIWGRTVEPSNDA